MHFLSLSLGALVFLAVLYSLTAQLLQFREKNSKKKKGAVGSVQFPGFCRISISQLLFFLPSPPFFSFLESNLHITKQNIIQAFDKR